MSDSTETASNLPPSTITGSLSLSASIVIDAPIEKVWAVLLDFPSYPEWNPFVREQLIVDKSKKRLDDQTPEAGKYLLMVAHIPPTMGKPSYFQKTTPYEIITAVDHDNHRVAWKNIDSPTPYILAAERWQALSVVEGGKTRYESREVFGGVAVYAMKILIAAKLQVAFNTMAETLKARCEQR